MVRNRPELSRRHFIAAAGGAATGALLPSGAASAAAATGHVQQQGPGGSATLRPQWDVMSDTWPAVDGLGRSLPLHDEVGAPRDDRFVGMFYFLWLGEHSTSGPWDNSKILAAHPEARNDKDHPAWGPMGDYHHWGEPHFGYYTSDDRYVIRQHAIMLADAGVDVVIFDVTNGFTYPEPYTALFETFAEVRAQGERTPAVAFLTPFGDSTEVVTRLYDEVYAVGLHEDLWFRWDDKPLILANVDSLDPGTSRNQEMLDFFTFRTPQPSYFVGPTAPDQWGWSEVAPQHVFHDSDGNAEQITVSVGENAVDGRLGAMSEPRSHGRSYHDDTVPTDTSRTAEGLNFQEQWDRALDVDPEFVFITGWNEWVAMRFDEWSEAEGEVIFVDQFDWEHSRDVEPMIGGHGDAFYYQLVSNIRRYKGARPLPAVSDPATITIDGRFEDWRSVGPEFRDHRGDTAHRDHPGWGDSGRYVNTTGRNDIEAAKVARDDQHVYFYVRTKDALTPHTDRHWMQLLIDTDGDPSNGWEGFDTVINRKRSAEAGTVERYTDGGPRRRGKAAFEVTGNELEIAVPRAMLGLGPDDPVRLDFKWVDNVAVAPGDVLDLIDIGDAAPTGRFRFRYAAP